MFRTIVVREVVVVDMVDSGRERLVMESGESREKERGWLNNETE